MINAVERMQNFMNPNEKVIICTTDDREIEVYKADDIFAEDEFIMIKHEDTMRCVNSNHVTRMIIRQYKKTLLGEDALEKIRNTVEEELA